MKILQRERETEKARELEQGGGEDGTAEKKSTTKLI